MVCMCSGILLSDIQVSFAAVWRSLWWINKLDFFLLLSYLLNLKFKFLDKRQDRIYIENLLYFPPKIVIFFQYCVYLIFMKLSEAVTPFSILDVEKKSANSYTVWVKCIKYYFAFRRVEINLNSAYFKANIWNTQLYTVEDCHAIDWCMCALYIVFNLGQSYSIPTHPQTASFPKPLLIPFTPHSGWLLTYRRCFINVFRTECKRMY